MLLANRNIFATKIFNKLISLKSILVKLFQGKFLPDCKNDINKEKCGLETMIYMWSGLIMRTVC